MYSITCWWFNLPDFKIESKPFYFRPFTRAFGLTSDQAADSIMKENYNSLIADNIEVAAVSEGDLQSFTVEVS
jgi:hypothetical protein